MTKPVNILEARGLDVGARGDGPHLGAQDARVHGGGREADGDERRGDTGAHHGDEQQREDERGEREEHLDDTAERTVETARTETGESEEPALKPLPYGLWRRAAGVDVRV